MLTETLHDSTTTDRNGESMAKQAPTTFGHTANAVFSHQKRILQAGCCLALVIAGISTADKTRGASDESATTGPAAETAREAKTDTAASPSSDAGSSNEEAILRQGEGRLFYTTIQIPANAETLYVSGSGASPDDDGNWGDMEAQTIGTFNKFKATLEERGWSMDDIVQVRAFAVAGEYGLLDFDGFNRGYTQFFGTDENPNKPVRSFVQVADLVVDGWLVEIEIRAARIPD